MENNDKPRGRPRKQSPLRPPIQLRFSELLFAKIDDAFHERRFKSRAETIRVLLSEALGVLE